MAGAVKEDWKKRVICISCFFNGLSADDVRDEPMMGNVKRSGRQ